MVDQGIEQAEFSRRARLVALALVAIAMIGVLLAIVFSSNRDVSREIQLESPSPSQPGTTSNDPGQDVERRPSRTVPIEPSPSATNDDVPPPRGIMALALGTIELAGGTRSVEFDAATARSIPYLAGDLIDQTPLAPAGVSVFLDAGPDARDTRRLIGAWIEIDRVRAYFYPGESSGHIARAMLPEGASKSPEALVHVVDPGESDSMHISFTPFHRPLDPTGEARDFAGRFDVRVDSVSFDAEITHCAHRGLWIALTDQTPEGSDRVTSLSGALHAESPILITEVTLRRLDSDPEEKQPLVPMHLENAGFRLDDLDLERDVLHALVVDFGDVPSRGVRVELRATIGEPK